MFHLVIEQRFECSKAPTSDSVSSVFSWALLEELIAVLFLQEGRERGGGGGGRGELIPFPRKLFFSNPSSNPTIPACVAQIEIPFPFFYCFFFFVMKPSPSAQNPISQPLKKANPSSHFTPSRPSYNFSETRQSACSPKTLQNDLRCGKTKRIQNGNKASQLYSQDITFYAV